jgi:hypothetical protein
MERGVTEPRGQRIAADTRAALAWALDVLITRAGLSSAEEERAMAAFAPVIGREPECAILSARVALRRGDAVAARCALQQLQITVVPEQWRSEYLRLALSCCDSQTIEEVVVAFGRTGPEFVPEILSVLRDLTPERFGVAFAGVLEALSASAADGLLAERPAVVAAAGVRTAVLQRLAPARAIRFLIRTQPPARVDPEEAGRIFDLVDGAQVPEDLLPPLREICLRVAAAARSGSIPRGRAVDMLEQVLPAFPAEDRCDLVRQVLDGGDGSGDRSATTEALLGRIGRLYDEYGLHTFALEALTRAASSARARGTAPVRWILDLTSLTRTRIAEQRVMAEREAEIAALRRIVRDLDAEAVATRASGALERRTCSVCGRRRISEFRCAECHWTLCAACSPDAEWATEVFYGIQCPSCVGN